MRKNKKSMSSRQMAKIILGMVEKKGAVSFVEIRNRIGDTALGDYSWTIAPNTILWRGMSTELLAAFQELSDRIVPVPTNLVIYIVDGDFLTLPIAERPTPHGYKKPHWLPVVFNLAKTNAGARLFPLPSNNDLRSLVGVGE